MRNKELTAATRTLTAALAEFGVSLGHQQAQHVLAKVMQTENYHVLSAKLKSSPPPSAGTPLYQGFLVEVSEAFVPEDGDAFDAVVSALEHFDIPAAIYEGTYVRVSGAPAKPATPVPSLEEQRRLAADSAFEHYDFGAGATVEDSDGWEFVSGNGPWAWRRAVFLSFGDLDLSADSTKAVFEVTFADKSAVPVSATATVNGVPIGHSNTRNPAA